MAWTGTALVTVLAIAYLVQLRRKKYYSRLPPGPRGLPVLGHLHLLGKFPHHELHRLSKSHGPIMYLNFGFVPVIIVSSPAAAEQFLKTHDVNFASRPRREASKYMSYEQRNLAFAPYGLYWRNMRKLCTLELLSTQKISSFKSIRWQEVGFLIDSIQKAALDGIAVDLSSKVSSTSADIACRIVFGKKYADQDLDERGFKAVMQEGMHLLATPNIGDYFPFIGALNLQGLNGRMKNLGKVFDKFLEKIIDEHVQSKPAEQKQHKDFVDIMLALMESQEAEYRIDRAHVKAVMLLTCRTC
ncbi:3,9-dihydroxypterocarpan 6A-monooxygenase [Bertholletia excelsa]